MMNCKPRNAFGYDGPFLDEFPTDTFETDLIKVRVLLEPHTQMYVRQSKGITYRMKFKGKYIHTKSREVEFYAKSIEEAIHSVDHSEVIKISYERNGKEINIKSLRLIPDLLKNKPDPFRVPECLSTEDVWFDKQEEKIECKKLEKEKEETPVEDDYESISKPHIYFFVILLWAYLSQYNIKAASALAVCIYFPLWIGLDDWFLEEVVDPIVLKIYKFFNRRNL